MRSAKLAMPSSCRQFGGWHSLVRHKAVHKRGETCSFRLQAEVSEALGSDGGRAGGEAASDRGDEFVRRDRLPQNAGHLDIVERQGRSSDDEDWDVACARLC